MQRCKGERSDKILTVHHMESRRTGGDSPANLITLLQNLSRLYSQAQPRRYNGANYPPLRDATQMTIMRWFIYKGVKELYPELS